MRNKFSNYNSRNFNNKPLGNIFGTRETTAKPFIDKDWFHERWVDRFNFERDWFQKNWIHRNKFGKN